MIRESVVAKLVATKRWSDSTARAFERAGHKCEYCDFDLLGSVDALKHMEVDHIVPLSKGGDPADPENLAIACRHCNFHLKRSWDPRIAEGSPTTRAELIAAVKKRIAKLSGDRIEYLEQIREIVGYHRKI